MSRYYIPLILLILPQLIQAQALHLVRGDKAYHHIYRQGDPITFQLKGERRFISHTIDGFTDNSIIIGNTEMPLDSIGKVKVEFSQGFFSPSNSKKLVIAGLGYFMLDQFNNTIVQGNEARISDRVTITSAALTGLGMLWMSLRHRKIRLGNRNRLIIIINRSSLAN